MSKPKKQRKPKKEEHLTKVRSTLEHRSGWYVHPDTRNQQRRMM